MKTFLLVALLLLPFNANAGRYWATVAKVGSGKTPKDAIRPAFAALKHGSVAVAFETKDAELVLIVTSDLSTLKKVAAKVHGLEVKGKDRDSRITPALRKKLLVEAKRLGADASWKPENYEVFGE